MEINDILKSSPIIPIITLKDIRDAMPLAQSLLEGGIKVAEITLRTNAAFDAIKVISRAFPELIIGAGTIVNPGQFLQAKEAGAQFAVSPGLTSELAASARHAEIPYLPGVATASEIMAARMLGFTVVKFFPAEALGGVNTLKSYAPVFPDIKFCPTGGITRTNMHDYLNQSNVIAIGGAWIAPLQVIEEKEWETITALARQITAVES